MTLISPASYPAPRKASLVCRLSPTRWMVATGYSDRGSVTSGAEDIKNIALSVYELGNQVPVATGLLEDQLGPAPERTALSLTPNEMLRVAPDAVVVIFTHTQHYSVEPIPPETSTYQVMVRVVGSTVAQVGAAVPNSQQVHVERADPTKFSTVYADPAGVRVDTRLVSSGLAAPGDTFNPPLTSVTIAIPGATSGVGVFTDVYRFNYLPVGALMWSQDVSGGGDS